MDIACSTILNVLKIKKDFGAKGIELLKQFKSLLGQSLAYTAWVKKHTMLSLKYF